MVALSAVVSSNLGIEAVAVVKESAAFESKIVQVRSGRSSATVSDLSIRECVDELFRGKPSNCQRFPDGTAVCVCHYLHVAVLLHF